MKSITSQAYFRALMILHASLMIGQVMMAGILYFFNQNQNSVAEVAATGQLWVYIAGGITIIGVLASALFFSNRLAAVRELPNLSQKLAIYRKVLITRYVTLEAPALFALIAYFQTNNLLLFIFPGLVLLLLLQNRPTKEKTISDLELSPSEASLLRNPEAIVTEL